MACDCIAPPTGGALEKLNGVLFMRAKFVESVLGREALVLAFWSWMSTRKIRNVP